MNTLTAMNKRDRVLVDERETELRRLVRSECKRRNAPKQTMRDAEKMALIELEGGSSLFRALQITKTFLSYAGHSAADSHPKGAA